MELPASVKEVAEIIGAELALKLVSLLPRAYGRRERSLLYVPKRLNVSHVLVAMIGYEAAQKMSRHFGGEILHLANCRHVFARQRHGEMRRMAQDGMPVRDIAQAFGLTERRVKDVLAETVTVEQPVPGADNPGIDISRLPQWNGPQRVARDVVGNAAGLAGQPDRRGEPETRGNRVGGRRTRVARASQ